MALSALVVVPIMFWFTRFVATYTRRGFRDLQRSMGDLNAVMEEAISGQKVVKAFGRNESVLATFRQQNQATYTCQLNQNCIRSLSLRKGNAANNCDQSHY